MTRKILRRDVKQDAINPMESATEEVKKKD
jgi:hypothetical protein